MQQQLQRSLFDTMRLRYFQTATPVCTVCTPRKHQAKSRPYTDANVWPFRNSMLPLCRHSKRSQLPTQPSADSATNQRCFFCTAQQIDVRAAAGPASVLAVSSAKNLAHVGKHLPAEAARPWQGKNHSFQAPYAREFMGMHLKIRGFTRLGNITLRIAASRLIGAHSRPPRPQILPAHSTVKTPS